jgi:hypothetical protein
METAVGVTCDGTAFRIVTEPPVPFASTSSPADEAALAPFIATFDTRLSGAVEVLVAVVNVATATTPVGMELPLLPDRIQVCAPDELRQTTDFPALTAAGPADTVTLVKSAE